MQTALTITWDEGNAQAHFAKHGVRFAYAAAVFLDANRGDFDTTRPNDGEERRKAVGMIEGKLFAVVYTMRADARRIISARRANARETRDYG